MTYNLFVDETCHIQHDKIPVMCIGYTKVPAMAYKELLAAFGKLKLDYKAPEEIKWNKFSAKRLPLYKAVVDFFFDNPILVISNVSRRGRCVLCFPSPTGHNYNNIINEK